MKGALKGFSLVEWMAALILSSILLFGAGSQLILSTRTVKEHNRIARACNDAQFVWDRLESDIQSMPKATLSQETISFGDGQKMITWKNNGQTLTRAHGDLSESYAKIRTARWTHLSPKVIEVTIAFTHNDVAQKRLFSVEALP